MMALFSESGRRHLNAIVKPGLLCAFDFDGTLSPIVQQPDQARMPPSVKQRLMDLSSLAPVAVITGRSLSDITSRLEFKPAYAVGNHGLEGIGGGEELSASYERQCLAWERELLDAFHEQPQCDAGVWVENKTYSLSVHYRQASGHQKAERQLIRLFERLIPPARIIPGKRVFNLLPHGSPDKGTALDRLMRASNAPCAIYVGDDVTDEDAFALNRSNLTTIRIGRKSGSAAKFFMARQEEIVRLLDELIRRLRYGQSV